MLREFIIAVCINVSNLLAGSAFFTLWTLNGHMLIVSANAVFTEFNDPFHSFLSKFIAFGVCHYCSHCYLIVVAEAGIRKTEVSSIFGSSCIISAFGWSAEEYMGGYFAGKLPLNPRVLDGSNNRILYSDIFSPDL